MHNYKLEPYTIAGVTLNKLIDENGECWYPLQSFFSKILLVKCTIWRYRDSSLYAPYMKVFELYMENNPVHLPVKAWCITTEGLCLILKNMKIKYASIKNTLVRETRLAEARAYFGIITSDLHQFITYEPDISGYDIWSILCIQNDSNIDKQTPWKICEKCHYYYPLTKKYFDFNSKGWPSKLCHDCKGVEFKCDNKIIQYLHNHKGLNLLFAIYKEDKDAVFEEIKKIIAQGDIS